MRAWRGAAGLLLFTLGFLATPAAGQVGAEGNRLMRFVCVDSDSGVLPLASAARTWNDLQDLSEGGEFTHCWAWNDDCAPRRLEPGRAPLLGGDQCAAANRLDVRVTDRASRRDERSGQPLALEITAAPTTMWREVPRGLLPKTVAASTALSVPSSAGPWRVQARLGDQVSSWHDVAGEAEAVQLELRPAVDLSFRITSEGAPLQGSRFSLVRPSQRRLPAEILGFEVADSEGRVVLVLPDGDRSAVIVTDLARSGAAFPRLSDVPPAIELGPGLTVSGLAENEAGDPVVGARLTGLSWIPNGFGLMQKHQARAGLDGRFAVTGLFAGSTALKADAGDLTFYRTLNLERSVDIGRIVLASSEAVWVQVVNAETGAPVPGARIQDAEGLWTTADEAGVARLSPVYGRGILVSVRGFLYSKLELPKRAGTTAQEPFVIGLSPSFWVRGVYVAPDGHTPAADGRVSAYNKDESRSLAGPVAADGTFSLDLPAGGYSLELSAGNAGLLRLDIRGAAGDVRDLGVVTAPASAWVSGYVVGQQDYAPVSGASVSYLRPSVAGPLMDWAQGNVATVTANAEGYFELLGLELGTSKLRIQADGFAPQKFQVEAAATGWIDAGVIELSRGRRVVVRSDVESGFVVVDPERMGFAQDRMTGTLSAGRVVFESVPEQPFDVMVYEEGEAVCERSVEDSTGDDDVSCDRSAVRVTGRVTIGDRPGDGMLVWQRRAPDDRFPEGVIRDDAGPLPRTEVVVSGQTLEVNATLDGEGRYRLERVLPGNWEVIWAPLSGGFQDAKAVVVDGGQDEMLLDLRYDGVSIEGLVLDPDRQPVHLAAVTVFPSRRTVSSDPNGRFRVLGLKPGLHELRARRGHLRSGPVTADLGRRGKREIVELVLENDPPSEELVVTLPGGRSGFCFVEMEGQQGRRQIVRMQSGRATAIPAPPLADKVRIACQADGRWILDGWRDLRQALDRGVEFDPYESSASLVLSGEPSATRVQVIGPGGWDLGSLRMWFGGARTFGIGETMANLPVGEYTLRWGDEARTLRTQRRRATVVDVED